MKRDIHIGNEVQNNTLYIKYKAVDALIIIAKKNRLNCFCFGKCLGKILVTILQK